MQSVPTVQQSDDAERESVLIQEYRQKLSIVGEECARRIIGERRALEQSARHLPPTQEYHAL